MTLDELIFAAEAQAKAVLLGTKDELAPSWLLDAPNQPTVVLTPWNGDMEKMLARAFIRQKLKDLGAKAYSVAMEAWAVSLPSGARPIIDRPSQDPRRVECVTIMATDGFHQKTKTLRIVRDKVTGKCTGLPEWDEVAHLGGNPKESVLESPFLDLLTTLQ